ncbi:STM4015 family protein [Paenibacillus kyungheensis]|uniref:STM4015 family protein n=1 Tax=Paenibacillus kyungheensis TaxID=1452732 RepID=A0AAX3LYH5_9BACL|nr:STM4015 family protein [Paenibacillus kyungheensis]WCT54941.1 STM4015 family protein [Paenibacillus kyungheensis]
MEVKLSVDYDQNENGVKLKDLITELVADVEACKAITSLIIGDWGAAYEDTMDDAIPALIEASPILPNLKSLYIGEMSSEECEVSWINQTNLGPVLAAYPQIESFTIQGSTDLSLEPLHHDKLHTLTIICGGLPKSVLNEIYNAHLPELTTLTLYLGVEDYGFDGSIEDILPFLNQNPFPKLRYLGLTDSEIQDEIAIAAANAPVLEQLDTLDLSNGTLSDKGAEALINSDTVKKLKHLNLNYHYMSDKMIKRWKDTGLSVDTGDQQEVDEDGEYEWRYPALTE